MKIAGRERGAEAEGLAAAWLQTRGLTLLAQNLRCRGGELDLVCLDQGTLAVVEVRQRAGGDFGGALASVTRRKQRRIIRAAGYFWQRQAAWRSYRMRFDVVGISGLPDGSYRIDWVKDAFRSA